ncbi:cysteine desulfurase [Halorubrum ezzemoulense]|jgi:selenocysteine lyase/cysteine desulfurase|uniref:Aminotransferase class V-fold PLP-dependent enzyme n=1 Tax=Halorubrum ezzemoulense TaxID=337243 RepID=A0A256K8Z6_HALEZ|nr:MULTISPECIES: aminotransferase class V-fold PLP-dependent enzyme [Halorubrum]MDB2223329.1 aminotransferase class V-fold PLP-dependent enzyme [Halorubrum ezzemoulense]MDB2240700.1 aminotransferase class V-fold PLP-dependent enzyme [Halorubrum ezzemoulense]MDB2280515.1 aminotransferase class V-fold PLP-dependent enzyme [Halorubrum ezzemoulense]MDB9233103.1 aminotransferase class V-fold PLP-dependent enzyme [Halorubrum ezzemoulense]MDB9251131.1 aminotransferase class V-fold PLP-dependent enzym
MRTIQLDDDGMTPRELRADVPALGDAAYFNFGAHGPSPEYVVEAAGSFIEEHEYGSATTDPYGHAFETYDRVRERIAAFVGADPEEVALTESTTDGITRVAGAIDWEPGDVVVRTDLEHPAGVLPWKRLEREGVEVRVLETEAGRVDRDEYAAAVADARLVCFSAITWTHGTRLPVADLVEVANDAGAFTLVDAVQSPGQGAMDVSEWGADAVAAAGHKWTLGPWGAGFLYVDRDAAADLAPHAVGYRGVEDPTGDEIEFKPAAGRFEVGTTTAAAHVGLVEALDAIEAVGLDAIEARIEALTDRLKDGVPEDRLLSPRAFESGLVTIDVDDPEATVERLGERDIVVRSLPHPDGIRVSVHAVSTEAEVDRLLDALEPEW